MPSMAVAMTAVSSQEPWLTAATTPRVTPIVAAIASADSVARVVRVLDHERPVQPVLVPELSRALRGERLIASEDLHRIARHQVQHQEAEHRDANEHRHCLHQTLQ